MPPDATTETDAVFEAAVASLRSFCLPPTPQNYAIWFEFHAGHNDKLHRALTIAMSNRRSIDSFMMAELHDLFFADSVERRAAREAQTTLREAAGRILAAGADAERYGETLSEAAVTIDTDTHGLADMIARLAEETTALSARSAELGQALRQSGDRIADLEKKLAAAHDAALTDALTTLPNRRAFDAMVREQAGLAMNTGETLSLLMLDIDHFKKVNDSWGHAVGDAVLRLVAATLDQHRPQTARVARYGGEEFAMLLPATSLHDAAAHAERLRGALAARRISLRANAETIGSVTISVGAARYEPAEPIGSWIERADAALYRAKREGRNRVVVEHRSSAA
ncbi:GGDEF domain-containing protein [Roseomonas fluvialis]|uniref:diguanylate cyclase n=1 Tax=Roseomonas fluvialis TaxID=1750527 RepID=A0ABN6NXK8_9PROT|nr:GGDEF domain-containing protein [Roseomonas fluvialis]BDG71047.1 GGDEF domain-containing protein [Roseomonas fluvialis]